MISNPVTEPSGSAEQNLILQPQDFFQKLYFKKKVYFDLDAFRIVDVLEQISAKK